MRLLVTGGAGFIGSNFARFALGHWKDAQIVVLDKLTYAGNLSNLADVLGHPRFTFIQGDICDSQSVEEAILGCNFVANFAAETHVDRSILDPGAFIRTDVEGTYVLLEAARRNGVERYVQVSTDEVYGHVELPREAREEDPLNPRSPYAASKAAGDHLVRAYFVTYGLPALITRGSNTYGPFQYPEKLIPLFITNALDGLPLPVYGDGLQVRDWLAVADHCSGVAAVLEHGQPGEIYNLGGGSERANLDIAHQIMELVGNEHALIQHVTDRPGHDRRYALNSTKARELGWEPRTGLGEGLAAVVDWYRERESWWRPIKSGSFLEYYRAQYEGRRE